MTDKKNKYSDTLESISDRKKQLIYNQGETIFKQGAFAPHIIYIIGGLVKIYLEAPGGRMVNVYIAKEGDFLAFSALFNENAYTYSAVALTESKVCMIDRAGLKELLKAAPDFAMEVTSNSIRKENRMLDLIYNLSMKQMRGKLASALLYLSSDEFAGYDLFGYLTRKDLADFASISVESAIKFLKEFDRDGIIKVDGRNILVTNKEKLNHISETG